MMPWLVAAVWDDTRVRGGMIAVAATLCLIALLPNGRTLERWRLVVGVLLGLLTLTGLAWQMPAPGPWLETACFAVLGLLSVGAALATIASRSPVYSAIWFAVSLLGVAGLFLLQGAQFLGIATVAVYAGAIVVTFLFVLMLAQPEGHTYYDRLSWSWHGWQTRSIWPTPRLVASAAAALFVVLITWTVQQPHDTWHAVRGTIEAELARLEDGRVADASQAELRGVHLERNEFGTIVTVDLRAGVDAAQQVIASQEDWRLAVAAAHPEFMPLEIRLQFQDVLADQHMAHLGGWLFTRHLIAVEVAGTLLLVALVSAIAIASHGRLQTTIGGEAAR